MGLGANRRLDSPASATAAATIDPSRGSNPGAPMHAPENLEIEEGIARFRPRGRSSLVEAVDRISGAIAFCREARVARLLVDASGFVGVSIPTLVDRFLMIEEWALESNGIVAVALVVHPEYIHERKFGVKVAADFGLVADVHTGEREALAWLSGVRDR
jgi:hypothetical protein